MDCNEDASFKEELNSFFNQLSPSISILVAGKTGVGKSALVNSLIGKKVADESDDLESKTYKVQSYQSSIRCQGTKNIRIIVWDSPGYEEEADQDHYFEQMKTVKDIDLLLFCTPLNENRWRTDDEKAMEAIQQAFGPSLWDQALIALTQANLYQNSDGPVTKAAYEKKVSQWTRKIHSVLKRLGVQKEVAAVATGNFVDMSLPNTNDWFSEFWTKAFCSMRPDKRVAFWHLNGLRIHFSSGPDRDRIHGSESYSRCLEEAASITAPPIVLTGEQKEKVKKSFWESFVDFTGDVMVPLATFVSAVASFASGVCVILSFIVPLFRK